MILAPQRAFLDAEMDAVREYLERGGALLAALEPDSDFDIGELRDYLGVSHNPAMTVHDQVFVPGNPPTVADRRFLITNRFSTHPSVTTASRSGSEIIMVVPGSFQVDEDMPELRANVVINSLPSSYADLDGDYRFDEDAEVRREHELAVAVERIETDTAGSGMRALIYGDAEMFSDQILRRLELNAFVVADGIRWLGGEEDFAGEVVSEEDVPILHTRSEDVAWFYAIIFGAPAAVMATGVFVLYGRRRSSAKTSEDS